MEATKLSEYDERLNRYLRLNTFPVAVRFLRSWDEMPARAKRPGKDLNNRFTTCQAIAMSRRYGWVLALGREDSSLIMPKATSVSISTRRICAPDASAKRVCRAFRRGST